MDFSNKRILFITQSYNSFVKEQIDNVAKHFLEVNVLVRYNPLAEISRVLPIHYLVPFRKKTILDYRNKPENVNIIITPVIYAPTAFFYKIIGKIHLRVVLKKIKKLKIKFDMIHSHFIWTSGYVGSMLKEKFHVPLVVTGHGFDVYSFPFKNEFLKRNTIAILEKSDEIITVSNSNKQYLRTLGIKKKINVIPNGYSKDLFYPMDKKATREEKKLSPNDKIIVSIGYLVFIILN